MRSTFILLGLIFYLILTVNQTYSQKRVVVNETTRTMPTYEFSDPDPVPNIGPIYPYFEFHGYEAEPEDKDWKFVELENDYIKVFITPEIGGKIWGAIEKSTGKEFIYYNHAVKFRDIAMRGPWTSGGIEINFGLIGHAPTCSTPVDYIIQENDDGSASCWIGAIDLASRTEWRVEIKLEPDKTWFTTRAIWYNPTTMQQSYYQWMNAAVKTAGNLEYTYPGSNYIGHDGSVHDWPMHPNGKDISWYEQNNFGRYKSYHVLGEYTGFYGGYWHDDSFGFGHYADYDAKPGKKLWIWGLSRQGMIWEQLLTDSDGQYTEIQSGRLFNQEAHNSIYSPFKHRSFAPYSTDEWTEYWYPVMATGGIVQGVPQATLNLIEQENALDVWLGANEPISDSLWIRRKGVLLGSYTVNMQPLEVKKWSMPFTGSKREVSVRLGDEYIIGPGGLDGSRLSRPLEPAEDFDWNSVQGLAMKAKSLEQERRFEEALKIYYECLTSDLNYLPALVGAAGLLHRRGEDSVALDFVKGALSVDTYHPEANFLYGAINEDLDRATDALDGYSIASASVEYRSAAFLGLARIHLKREEYGKAVSYARKSVENNRSNIPAHEILLISLRNAGNEQDFNKEVEALLVMDPLNHLARFEKYLSSRRKFDYDEFRGLIRNELPQETYLELAIKYANLGYYSEALEALNSAPEHPMVNYWRAWLSAEKGMDGAVADYLQRAESASPELVFPFRKESYEILMWAREQSDSWKTRYYLSMLCWNSKRKTLARIFALEIGESPDYAPYYLYHAQIYDDRLMSLLKAYELAPDNWRVSRDLANYYFDQGKYEKALETVEADFQKDNSNYYLGLLYAKTLLYNQRNQECQELLESLQVLPNEGATEGHQLYRISNLNLAVDALNAGNTSLAEEHLDKSRQYPENLGVGRPYDVDERIEDYMMGMVMAKKGDESESRVYYQKVIIAEDEFKSEDPTAGHILSLAAMIQTGDRAAAEKIFASWEENMPKQKYVLWTSLFLNGNFQELRNELDQTVENRNPGSDEYYLDWVFNFLTEVNI